MVTTIIYTWDSGAVLPSGFHNSEDNGQAANSEPKKRGKPAGRGCRGVKSSKSGGKSKSDKCGNIGGNSGGGGGGTSGGDSGDGNAIEYSGTNAGEIDENIVLVDKDFQVFTDQAQQFDLNLFRTYLFAFPLDSMHVKTNILREMD